MNVLSTIFILFLACNTSVGWIIPGAIAVGSLLASFASVPLYCLRYECCTKRWIPLNLAGLNSDLRSKVFGQHLAREVAFKAIKGHVNNPNPPKALVLSFHGWTGSGKNHVSRLIADSLYKKGMDSIYTHQVIATHDFPHNDKVKEYSARLKKFVTEKVKLCPQALFIFDEVDKVPHGLMDALKPFLDHYNEIDGVDYRKSIFIFLSNTGANKINEEVLDHWRKGKKREDLTIKQMDDVINKGAFNQEGGLRHSQLILHNLIDYFIPFLPLERKHIKQCVMADLEAKKMPLSEEVANQVVKELQYFTEDEKVFSKSGCKKVSSKVDFIVG